MIRFATIGTNFIVDWFLEAAAQVEGIRHQAVYSRTEEEARSFAAKHGVETCYTDIDQMAEAEDIDAVYVASPNSIHFEQAVLMLSHGKHVLCEKSIASNSKELAIMLDTAKEHHVVLLEAMRSVFSPGFFAIKENLPKLGKIRRVSFQYSQYSSRYDKFKAGIIENAFNPAFSNGSLMDIGVYCVHPLMKLFGKPERIHGEALLLTNGIDGAGTILASYGDMQADLLYSKIANSYLPNQIQGEDAAMSIDDITGANELIIHDKKGNMEHITVEKNPLDMTYEIKEWARLIENGLKADEHNQFSVLSLELMDEARRQMGVVFPADNK